MCISLNHARRLHRGTLGIRLSLCHAAKAFPCPGPAHGRITLRAPQLLRPGALHQQGWGTRQLQGWGMHQLRGWGTHQLLEKVQLQRQGWEMHLPLEMG